MQSKTMAEIFFAVRQKAHISVSCSPSVMTLFFSVNINNIAEYYTEKLHRK